MKRKYLLLGWIFSCCAYSYAQQPPGIDELYSAGTSIKSYYFGFSDLAFSVGGVMGLLGGLRVFSNWQAGLRHIDAQVSGWFFSCLFLLLSGIFLRGVFQL